MITLLLVLCQLVSTGLIPFINNRNSRDFFIIMNQNLVNSYFPDEWYKRMLPV